MTTNRKTSQMMTQARTTDDRYCKVGCVHAPDLAVRRGEPIQTRIDDSLATRLAAGDAMAFTELYERLGNRLFAFALRMLRDRHDAEDAVQHAFLEFVRARPQLHQARSVEAWMFKSVRFTCLDEFRRRGRHPEAPTDQLPELASFDEVPATMDPELESAIALLTDEQVQVIHLKHVEGCDGDEIAEIMGSTRPSVYAMASRAESRLKKLLDPVESPAIETSSPVEQS